MQLLRNVLPLVRYGTTLARREIAIEGVEITLKNFIADPLKQVALRCGDREQNLSAPRVRITRLSSL